MNLMEIRSAENHATFVTEFLNVWSSSEVFVYVWLLSPQQLMSNDHKVVDLWSKGQGVTFQIFVGGTPFTRC